MGELIHITNQDDQLRRFSKRRLFQWPGTWKRLAFVLLTDSHGDYVLQRRAKGPGKGLLTTSASGHVGREDAPHEVIANITDETPKARAAAYTTAAYRELHEELGVSGLPLTRRGTFKINRPGYYAQAWLFEATLPEGAVLRPNPQEVAEIVRIHPSKLLAQADDGGAGLTAAVRDLVDQCLRPAV